MPYTYKGIGTKYYGKRDLEEDGSYLTTEWVVFVYLPLIPLRSYRVRPVGKGTNAIIYRSQKYLVSNADRCWAQIRNTYLVGGAIAATLFGGIALASHVDAQQSNRQQPPVVAAGLTEPLSHEI